MDWKEVTITFNGNKIDLPRVIIIKLQNKFKIRLLMNSEPLLFHLMLKQGSLWQQACKRLYNQTLKMY